MNTTHRDHLPSAPGSTGSNPPDRAQGQTRRTPREGTALSRPLKTALLMIALVGGFYLLREHWNHVAGNWIYLLLLACPLMHLFHGHGGHGGHSDHATPPAKPTNKDE